MSFALDEAGSSVKTSARLGYSLAFLFSSKAAPAAIDVPNAGYHWSSPSLLFSPKIDLKVFCGCYYYGGGEVFPWCNLCWLCTFISSFEAGTGMRGPFLGDRPPFSLSKSNPPFLSKKLMRKLFFKSSLLVLF